MSPDQMAKLLGFRLEREWDSDRLHFRFIVFRGEESVVTLRGRNECEIWLRGYRAGQESTS